MSKNIEKDLNDVSRPMGRNASVRSRDVRYNMAIDQTRLNPVPIDTIISLTNEVLKNCGIAQCKNPINNTPENVNYREIKADNNLADVRDIVWMKFTTDGYLGVVATSNDINFDIPQNAEDYTKRKGRQWSFNTSGILIHKLGKEWDTSFVLIFPLKDLPEDYSRHDIELFVGNYLINNGVPILDFYSHRCFARKKAKS